MLPGSNAEELRLPGLIAVVVISSILVKKER